MHHAPDDTTPRCPCCSRWLYDDELGHTACRVCEQRTDARLAELPGPHGLYARLSGALMPGSTGSDGRVSGSRTAPLPLRLDPLSLMARGGVITILQSWLIDWHETLGWGHPRWEGDLQGQLDQVVGRLRANLPWAAEHHPAFDEFYGEVCAIVATCRANVTGERAERRIPVACGTDDCGTIMRITLSTDGQRCPGCGTQYGRDELLDLTPVRSAA